MATSYRRYPLPKVLSPPTRQRGFALLALLAIISVALAYVLVTGLNAANIKLERERRADESLARAKDALIAYAASNAFTDPTNALNGRFGHLPCPEDPSSIQEGSGAGNCRKTGDTLSNALSVAGRLPWRDLGLPAPRDANSECLWYVVSGRYKRTQILGIPALGIAGSPLLDQDGYLADGQIEIFTPQGTRLAGEPGKRVVAVIFAPGPPQGSQTHTNSSASVLCPGNFTASNYLDADVSGSPINDPDTGSALTIDNSVVSATPGGVTHLIAGTAAQRGINDRLIYITRDEIYAAMVPFFRDLTRRATKCVADFAQRNLATPGDKRLPWASRIDIAEYHLDTCNYNDRNDWYAGRLADRVNTSAIDVPNSWYVDDNCSGPNNPRPRIMLMSDDTPCLDWGPYIPVWQRWKSLFFYHVAPDFGPHASTPSTCGTCLQVNGAGNYAAVILFAGRVLDGQNRSSNGTRDDADNYLEGRNDNNIGASDGSNRNYETRPMSSGFNDILYCLAPDLSVAPCPLP